MSVFNVKYILLGSMVLLSGGCNFDTKVPVTDGGNTASNETSITQLHITQLQITPSDSRIPVTLQEQLFTTAILNDGSTTDVTGDTRITWSSSDESIATVDSTGRVTGVRAGFATITATNTDNGRITDATATLRVTDAAVTDLAIAPTKASSSLSGASATTAFFANATLSDGSTLNLTNNPALTWRSGDGAIATVNNTVGTKGLATAVGLGTTTITVTGLLNGQNFIATADLTVTP